MTAVLLLALAGGAAAAKVYKWVDDEGNVHFGDRPAGQDAQEMELRVRPPAQRSQPVPLAPIGGNIGDVMEEDRLRRREAREQEKQAREERQRNCALARDRLRRFVESNYLYDIDDSGNRVILSNEQREASEQRARDEIQRYCG